MLVDILCSYMCLNKAMKLMGYAEVCADITLQECCGLLASLILILFGGLMTTKILNATTSDIMIQQNFII